MPSPSAAKVSAPSDEHGERARRAGRGQRTENSTPADPDDQHRLDQEDDEGRGEHGEQVGDAGSGVARMRFRIPDSRRTTSVIPSPAKQVAATP